MKDYLAELYGKFRNGISHEEVDPVEPLLVRRDQERQYLGFLNAFSWHCFREGFKKEDAGKLELHFWLQDNIYPRFVNLRTEPIYQPRRQVLFWGKMTRDLEPIPHRPSMA